MSHALLGRAIRTLALRLHYALMDLKLFFRVLLSQDCHALVHNIGVLVQAKESIRQKIHKLRRIIRLTANGWTAYRINRGMFEFRHKNGYILIQPDIGVLDEDLFWWIPPTEHGCAVDIGGYRGETALHLAISGYKKIFVFEPVAENVVLTWENIKRNAKLFQGIYIKVYPVGAGAVDGTQIIRSAVPPGDPGFGTASKTNANHYAKINIWSWQHILAQIPCKIVDLVKVDCEGCERALLTLSKDIVRRVKWWVVEVHDRNTEKTLLEQFATWGYVCTNYRRMGPEISLLVLRRKELQK